MPLVSVQVSGLWQYRQRHMQPVVQATTRTPGPIDGGAGREGVEEPHVAAGERLANALLGDAVAQMDPQLEGALGLERSAWRRQTCVPLRGRCG